MIEDDKKEIEIESPPIPEDKRQLSLRASVWDGSLYSAMVGFGEIYYIPLLLAIGGTNFQVGVLTGVPQLCLAFSQFIALILVNKLMNRKRIIVNGSAIHASMLGLMFVGLITHVLGPWLFIILVSAYFFSVGIVQPAWNSLMGDLTREDERGKYFGRRNGLCQLVAFLAILAGGLIIQHFANNNNPLVGFAIIIAAAFLSRTGSVIWLAYHYEVPYKQPQESYFSFWQFILRSPWSNFAHFVYFVALMSLTTQISAPYFTIYMLKALNMSYIQYTFAIGAQIVTMYVAMRRWGVICDLYGNRVVLRATALIIPIIPILWLFSQNYSYIIFIQVISGFIWGGWALSTGNFIFDAVTPEKRARCAAYFNFFNCTGVFIGAMIGAFLINHLPQAINTGAMKLELFSPIEFLFLISGILRAVVAFIFIPTVREVRSVDKCDTKKMFFMLTEIRPFAALQFEPFTGFGKREITKIFTKSNGGKKNEHHD